MSDTESLVFSRSELPETMRFSCCGATGHRVRTGRGHAYYETTHRRGCRVARVLSAAVQPADAYSYETDRPFPFEPGDYTDPERTRR